MRRVLTISSIVGYVSCVLPTCLVLVILYTRLELSRFTVDCWEAIVCSLLPGLASSRLLFLAWDSLSGSNCLMTGDYNTFMCTDRCIIAVYWIALETFLAAPGDTFLVLDWGYSDNSGRSKDSLRDISIECLASKIWVKSVGSFGSS